jgi:hypothetical protein
MSKNAFSDEFKAILVGKKYTKWAVNLSEEQLLTLLWMISEYGGRVWSYNEPISNDDPDNLHLIEANKNVRSTEALRIIAAIYHGEEISHFEAIDRIRDSVERFMTIRKSSKIDFNRKTPLDMATKLGENDLGEFKRVAIDNQVFFINLVKLLVEKGVITTEELVQKVKQT